VTLNFKFVLGGQQFAHYKYQFILYNLSLFASIIFVDQPMSPIDFGMM
jgi:hypothetical protein